MATAKPDNKASKPDNTPKGTFGHQATLPRLPIPELEDTLSRYLRSVEPLVDKDAFKKTSLAVVDFLKPGGLGRQLHSRLLARAADKKDSSWLIDWWRSLMYLEWRLPVVINVSYFYQFKASNLADGNDQIARAANLTLAAAAFRDLLATDTWPADLAGKAPLCMSMYRAIYNTCRIPAPEHDQVVSFDLLSHNNVLVIARNRFYLVDIGGVGKRISKGALMKELAAVQAHACSQPAALPVGALTSAHRDFWAEAFPILINGKEENITAFRAIANTAFAVCLDSQAPATHLETARGLLHGDGRNRWYDKAMQFIVFANGKAGMLGEHSMSDGMPTATAVDWMLTQIESGKLVTAGVDTVKPVSEVRFALSDAAVERVRTAERDFDKLVADHEVSCLIYNTYGREGIKGFKQAPDAFAQMAIQLAYYRAFGKLVATYEPAHTRAFLHGRTACIRSVSTASAAWVHAMCDAAATTDVKRALLTEAVVAHGAYTKLAAQGQDVDRHLLGLRLVMQGDEATPALFADPTFAKSKYWAISTSNLSSEHFDNWGWGEVVDDGIGVAYSVLKDDLRFNVCARVGTGAAKFTQALQRALDDMKAIHASATPVAKL